MPTVRRTGWWKSSHSAQANGCVEVKMCDTGVAIRDSKLADSPMISFSPEQWSRWLHEVRTDELTNDNGAVYVTTEANHWVVSELSTETKLIFNEEEWTAFRLGAADDEFDQMPEAELIAS